MQTIIRNGVTIVRNSITVRRGNTFNKLSSNPQAWEYTGVCIRELGNCDLCNTELVYKHKLHCQQTGKVLWIGCECVKWYYESWQPNGFEKILLALKDAQMRVHKKYIKERLDEFKANYPELFSYFLGENKWYSYRYNTLKCDIVDSFSGMYITRRVPTAKFRGSLSQKGYLNKFELESLKSALFYGEFPMNQMEKIADDLAKALNQTPKNEEVINSEISGC